MTLQVSLGKLTVSSSNYSRLLLFGSKEVNCLYTNRILLSVV